MIGKVKKIPIQRPIMASGVFCAYNSLIPILSENPLDEIGKVENYKY